MYVLYYYILIAKLANAFELDANNVNLASLTARNALFIFFISDKAFSFSTYTGPVRYEIKNTNFIQLISPLITKINKESRYQK